MKRITILFLGLAIALMAGNIVDARVKSSASSNVVSLARSLACCDIDIDLDNPQQVNQKTGMSRIYFKKTPASRANNMEEEGHYIYGINAKATAGSKKTVTIKATGSNAFYYEITYSYNVEEEYGATTWTFGFSSKANRDKFWKYFKNEPYAEKGYKNGWYTASTWSD